MDDNDDISIRNDGTIIVPITLRIPAKVIAEMIRELPPDEDEPPDFEVDDGFDD